ncbi:hypothetical protein DPEC_G00286770 [Dallia pectoralis]|uniref:Uncharacterized protein n=1 Tax=Dallia pectoralis TaxID=75939 RepID=A0ACC2FK34_DALPE|nr:hypothetical protein DPEC_G00286770 [Dallia pectoralis]
MSQLSISPDFRFRVGENGDERVAIFSSVAALLRPSSGFHAAPQTSGTFVVVVAPREEEEEGEEQFFFLQRHLSSQCLKERCIQYV